MPAKQINLVFKIVKRCLKKAYFMVPFVGIVSSLILYFLRNTSIPSFFIVTLLAWLSSDAFFVLFIRGGSGIVQIPVFGSKSQFKGIAFLGFFIAIFLVSIVVNVLTSGLTEMLSGFLSNFIVCLGIGFLLAFLVFADLTVKYYNR
jgi:hypothetical protein